MTVLEDLFARTNEGSLERVESLVRAAHQAIELKLPGKMTFADVAAGVLAVVIESGRRDLNSLCLDFAVDTIGT